MKTKIVRHSLETLPALTKEQEARLTKLSELSDDQIDFSDIPEWKEENFKNAVRGRFFRRERHSVTAHIDADVLEWLKSGEDGFDNFETRMNAVLRRAMLKATAGARPPRAA